MASSMFKTLTKQEQQWQEVYKIYPQLKQASPEARKIIEGFSKGV